MGEFTIDKFYEFGMQGKLMAMKCKSCGKLILPPRPICPNCYSNEFEWAQLKGTGEVVTYTIIHVAAPEYASLAPYGVAVIKLDEGVPFIGMVIGEDMDKLKVGARVKVSFEKIEREKWPQRPRIKLQLI